MNTESLELCFWLRTHIAERRKWKPHCVQDTVWINWAAHWLDQIERGRWPT